VINTNWTDTTISTGVTLIRAVHFTQLRDRINNVRQFRGLPTYSWSESLSAGTTLIKASHLTELRTALDPAYRAATGTGPTEPNSPPITTDTTISAGTTPIRVRHIIELRNAVTMP